MRVNFEKLHEDAIMPSYAKPGDAGLDLTATRVNEIVSNGETKFLEYGTGLAVEIPEGHVGLLFSRSSVTKKDLMLKNAVGVIDSGYRGEICLRFKVLKPKFDIYQIGEKIGQLIIVPIPKIEPKIVETLSSTERGEGGFGSTGK